MSGLRFFMFPDAPDPVAPFSHAVEYDGWCFVTGQMPTYPGDDARPLASGIREQTVRVMENLNVVLRGLGLGFAHVACARVYLTHFNDDYTAMNEVYASYFSKGQLPARTCIGVTGLARGARVEIDLLARR
jgi:2-iminobutanoate/2-iminopropanoate deaminase